MELVFFAKNRRVHSQRHLWGIIIGIAALTSLLIVQGSCFTSVTRAQAEDFVVNLATDSGDGVCDSTCTLRDALNSVIGGDTDITFALSTPVTITLTAPLTVTTANEAGIYITGPGSELLTIDGANLYRPFYADQGSINNINISGMTIANGLGTNGGAIYSTRKIILNDVKLIGNSATNDGGAIYYTSFGSLSLTDVVIADNQAGGNGGGVYSDATTTMHNVTMTGNSATGSGGAFFNDTGTVMNNITMTGNSASDGGGIYNAFERNLTATNLTLANNSASNGGAIYQHSGTVRLTDSTVFNNSASNGGGGLYIQGGEGGSGKLFLTSSTVYSNSASSGGGLFNFGSDAEIINSTVSGNSATGDGGGIVGKLQQISDNFAPAIISLASSTVAYNSAGGSGGGITNDDSDFISKSSIIASNTNAGGAAPDCSNSGWPTFVTDYTLVGNDNGCNGLFAGTDNLVGTAAKPIDALLGRLSFNGGSTFTHALLTTGPGSPARDAGDPFGCTDLEGAGLVMDQRGAPRERDSNADGTARCDMGAFEAGLGNDTWTRAVDLQLTGSASEPMTNTQEYLDRPGQSRWYKFSVQPGSTLQIKLKDLAANYDLTVYKDIDLLNQTLSTPTNNADLVQLTAEFAPDSYAPDSYAPDSYAPDSYAPDAFAPDSYAPDSYAPDVYAPDSYAPDSYAPDSYAPDSYAPDSYAPDSYAPDSYAPDSYAPDSYAPLDAYISAQMRSLVGVSAFDGVADEVVTVDTWDNKDDYYVRVRGRNGVFNLDSQFNLQIQQFIGTCDGVTLTQTDSTLTAVSGDYRTLILADFGRMDGLDPLLPTLQTRLNAFANRAEIQGRVVDMGDDPVLVNANAQADTFNTCPTAKNLVASTIKELISDYRDANPNLEYIVIVGNDDVIPFFRLPDRALLANEKNYVPPVDQTTTSYSSLILGYILSQDPYGSTVELSLSNTTLPIPDMPVGRLVETPADIITMLDAYDATVTAGTPGQVPTPQSSLVTGYDFLEDAAEAVQAELDAGIGSTADTLIAPRDLSPLSNDPLVWSADDLRAELLTTRKDVMFLAGHFSASSALAADYSSRLLASEVASSSVDLENVLIFSAGCHSGYNVVNEHGIPNVTQEPDWAQAFAQKGATLIGGTGYQYGDTDFLEYSERIYLNFSKELRAGTGPVAIGDALVKAKQTYLAETAQLRGIHEKAFLVVTIYGLPMLSVDMPFGRDTPSAPPSIVGTPSTVAQNPGNFLGLQVADVTIPFSLTPKTLTLESVTNNDTVVTTYISGTDGVASNPAEPVLPLEIRNVSVPGTVLRGVGFRGGSYTDQANITPLTGAATTEIRGVHAPFLSEVFFPILPWRVNYFGALADPVDGLTRLNITPAQFVSDGPTSNTGFLRQWGDMGFRFYYSNNIATFDAGSIPSAVAPPAFVKIGAQSGNENGNGNGNVDFATTVVGDLSAGVQEVWVTYTICGTSGCNGTWQSLDLSRNADDSTIWEGTLALGGTPAGDDIRYVVQAVNGVGLVSLNTNLGEYFTPDIDPGDLTASELVVTEPLPTELTFESPPSTGVYNEEIPFTARLTSDGVSLSNQIARFAIGSQLRSATTDTNGQATVTIPLLSGPGDTDVRVTFAGSTDYQASESTSAFTVDKQTTQIVLSPINAVAQVGASTTMTAALSDATGTRLREQSLFFIVSGNGESYAVAQITNFVGNAQLGLVPLPEGTYSVDAYFSGSIPLPSGTQLLTDANYLPAAASGTLTIEAAVNNAPTAVNDEYATAEDTTLTVSAPGVLGNDTDVDSSTLSALLEGGPSNGTLSLSLDGSFIYTPTGGFVGNDSFTYKANDGTDDSNVATVTITVNAGNSAPSAVNDDYATTEDTTLTVSVPGVLGNDTDADPDTLSALLDSGPSNGTLSLSLDGSFIYTPTGGFVGDDSFTYKANDGTDDSNVATVTITVNAGNNAPSALNDDYATTEDTTLTVSAPGLLGNDTDADPDTLSALLDSGPSNGTLSLSLDGSFIYTPTGGFVGNDSFTYKANDGTDDSNVATVTITVSGGGVVFATCGGFDVFEISPGVYEAPDFSGNLIVGTNGYNWLIGTSGPDLILGLNGPDDIYGRGGADVICGGRGIDIIKGQGGSDILYGNEHSDWIIGGGGSDIIYGGSGWDDLEGNGGKDELHGGPGYDILLGGGSNDELFGGNGPDDLYGQGGNDDLDGGNGNDLCKGGSGKDTITNCEGTSAASMDSRVGINEIQPRLANDDDGGQAIIARINELFLPLVVR